MTHMFDSGHHEDLISTLSGIRDDMVNSAKANREIIRSVHPNYRRSAENFIHYLSLRTHKIRELQQQLSSKGLSSIGHSERYTLANIENILFYLHLEKGKEFRQLQNTVDYFEGRYLLHENTRRLLGVAAAGSNTRIMVTLPAEAAENYHLVRDLITAGMQVARINCSHDTKEVWEGMVDNIRKASTECMQPCLIYMDLAGPKLRTGQIRIFKKKHTKKSGRKEKLKVRDFIRLNEGDIVKVYFLPVTASGAKYDKQGRLKSPAEVSITLPESMQYVLPGQRILFDDGKIAGRVDEVLNDHIRITITRTDTKGGKLRGEKGINLPDTRLDLPSLTKEDTANLPFVAGHADIIGYSFVRTPADVFQLQSALAELDKEGTGLVLKIETREAFENFPAILLAAMRSPSVGVMIARGDLAVELGAERISEVQEELLWLCDAAHVPNIWATQVLEKLAKEGLATRAEITDASMSARAECVMLNKGPYIVEVVRTLSNILERMEAHQYKKEGALRALHVAQHFFKTSHALLIP